MEKRGETLPEKSPYKNPSKMDTKIDPPAKHVPKIGGLRVQRESVPRRSKAETPKYESYKV